MSVHVLVIVHLCYNSQRYYIYNQELSNFRSAPLHVSDTHLDVDIRDVCCDKSKRIL